MKLSKHFKRFNAEHIVKIQDNIFHYRTVLNYIPDQQPDIILTDSNVFLLSDWYNLINVNFYDLGNDQTHKISNILNMTYKNDLI